MSLRLRLLLLFLPIALGSQSTAGALDPHPEAATVRQVVIRAPKMPFVTAMMAGTDDEALARTLGNWVAEGKATVLSEIATRAFPEQRVKLRLGQDVRHAVGNDQDFQKATISSQDWENVLVGTFSEFEMRSPTGTSEGSWIYLRIAASHSPRNEEDVAWPVWWPPNPATKPNWYQNKDFFHEKALTETSLRSGSHRILAVMRCADQFEPDPLRNEMLDVTLLYVGPPPDSTQTSSGPLKPETKAQPSKKAASSPFSEESGDPLTEGSAAQRCTMFTFGVTDREAVDLLSQTGPHRDKELLDHLLLHASLRDVIAVSTRSGQRAEVESVRTYSVPTEMPTIPSAWEEHPSGTRIEIEPVFPRWMNLNFEYHPVPPRRAEWRCALDTPDLFMWQPQFITRKVETGLHCGADGIALVSAMRTPDCAIGVPGLQANETLIMIARLDGDFGPPQAPPSGIPTDDSRLEIETVVFEVPASEAANWPSPAFQGPADDSQRFSALLARVDAKGAKIAAQATLVTPCGGSSKASAVEQVITVEATENNDNPARYRPTAMQEHDVGTTLEVEAVSGDAQASTLSQTQLISLKYTLAHDVAMPQLPGYREMIASLDEKKNPGRKPPPAIFFKEEWKGHTMVKVGGTQFIGSQVPPGDKMKNRLHLAFVRTRMIPLPCEK